MYALNFFEKKGLARRVKTMKLVFRKNKKVKKSEKTRLILCILGENMLKYTKKRKFRGVNYECLARYCAFAHYSEEL